MHAAEQNLQSIPQKSPFSRIGLACFVILAVTSVLQLGINYLTVYFAPHLAESPWYIWGVTFIPLYVVAIPIGMLLFRRIPSYETIQKKLRFKDLLIFLVMCYPVMYIGNLAGTLLNMALHTIVGTDYANPLESYVFGSNIWLSVMFMVILAPIIEEFVFRKLIIDRVRPYGEGVAVLVSALMFGLFHGNLNQFFYAFGLGAIFAFIYVKTGRLRYTIFLHMTINFFSGVIAPLLLQNVNLDALTQMNLTDPAALRRYLADHLLSLMTYGLYSIVFFSLTIAGFILLIARRRAFVLERGPLQPQQGAGFKTLFLNVGMLLFFVGVLALFALSLL